VRDYVLADPHTDELCDRLSELLSWASTHYAAKGRRHLAVAVGAPVAGTARWSSRGVGPEAPCGEPRGDRPPSRRRQARPALTWIGGWRFRGPARDGAAAAPRPAGARSPGCPARRLVHRADRRRAGAARPPAPVLPRSLIEGMALAGEGGAPVTTRRVAARAALAVLHADAIPASVERLATARRHRYRVTVRPPAAAGGPDAPAAAARPPRSRPRRRPSPRPTSAAPAPGCAGSSSPAAPSAGAMGRPSSNCWWGRRRRPRVWWPTWSGSTSRPRPCGAGDGRSWAVRSQAGVATLLSSIGAHLGRLEFESGRVVREVRSGVNRRLNAETRTFAAASPPPSPSSRPSTVWSGIEPVGSGCHPPSARRPCCAGAGPGTVWRCSRKPRAAAGRRWPVDCTAWWPSRGLRGRLNSPSASGAIGSVATGPSALAIGALSGHHQWCPKAR